MAMEKLGLGSFHLEPDGFSIHTFELTRKLSAVDYKKLRDKLYRNCPAGGIFRDRDWPGQGERHRCQWFRKSGLRISLERDDYDVGTNCYLRIAVNPRKLIDPGSSYLGILPPDEGSIRSLGKKFMLLLKDSGLPCALNAYQLSRVDLCVNIRCDTSKLFKELLRASRKLPAPEKYERVYYQCKDKKASKKVNKHYIRLAHATRELVMYDKTYQVVENGLLLDQESLPKGILRFEVHEARERIKKIEKKLGSSDVEAQLFYYVENSKAYLLRCFGRAFPDEKFLQKEELEEVIHAKADADLRDAMTRLVEILVHTQSVEKAMKKLENEGFQTAGVLEQFQKLGVSPVPLRKKFCARSLPGPASLLKKVSEGAVRVCYTKGKSSRR